MRWKEVLPGSDAVRQGGGARRTGWQRRRATGRPLTQAAAEAVQSRGACGIQSCCRHQRRASLRSQAQQGGRAGGGLGGTVKATMAFYAPAMDAIASNGWGCRMTVKSTHREWPLVGSRRGVEFAMCQKSPNPIRIKAGNVVALQCKTHN